MVLPGKVQGGGEFNPFLPPGPRVTRTHTQERADVLGTLGITSPAETQ